MDIHFNNILHIHNVIIVSLLRQFDKTGNFTVWQFERKVFEWGIPVLQLTRTYGHIKSIVPQEGMDDSFFNGDGLQIWKYLVVEILMDKGEMHRIHFLFCLIEKNLVPF